MNDEIELTNEEFLTELDALIIDKVTEKNLTWPELRSILVKKLNPK